MAEDFEEQEEVLAEVDTDDFLTEVFPYTGAGTSNSGLLIFPRGATVFCEQVGAIALRIADKTGEIEALVEATGAWVTAGKPSGLKLVK